MTTQESLDWYSNIIWNNIFFGKFEQSKTFHFNDITFQEIFDYETKCKRWIVIDREICFTKNRQFKRFDLLIYYLNSIL